MISIRHIVTIRSFQYALIDIGQIDGTHPSKAKKSTSRFGALQVAKVLSSGEVNRKKKDWKGLWESLTVTVYLYKQNRKRKKYISVKIEISVIILFLIFA